METVKIRCLCLLTAAVLMLLPVGCGLDGLGEPESYHVWTQAEVEAQGYRVMTIWDFKREYFYEEFGAGVGASLAYKVIPDKVAIKGKVISSDLSGNIYRSLYIQDETGAIEIKVGAMALYNDYKLGQTIYVRCDGLALGNYRYMLSLGAESEDRSYANGYIDLPASIEKSILRGEIAGFDHGRTLARGEIDYTADTIVIDRYNAGKLRDPQDLGRLIRITGLESVWGRAESGAEGFSNSDIYPSFLQPVRTLGTVDYINWYWQDGDWTNGMEVWPRPNANSLRPDYPTWAFRDWGHNYYGSALFRLGESYFVVRSSGYSLFALERLPEDGDVVDMTAIYTKFSAATGDFAKYQLLLNSSSDVAFSYK